MRASGNGETVGMGEPIIDAENAPGGRDVDEARDEAIRRLFTSDQRLTPSVREQEDLTALNDAAIELGTQILARCPRGRETNIAMTHLEDVLIRARRAVFEAML